MIKLRGTSFEGKGARFEVRVCSSDFTSRPSTQVPAPNVSPVGLALAGNGLSKVRETSFEVRVCSSDFTSRPNA